MTMDELIERLEKATGPEPTLDRAIEERLQRGVFTPITPDMDEGDAFEFIHHSPGRGPPWPRYTASIDAALTLVPKGYQSYVDTGAGPGFAHACVWTDYPHRIMGGAREGATPAIALCIAALKAMAAIIPNGQSEAGK